MSSMPGPFSRFDGSTRQYDQSTNVVIARFFNIVYAWMFAGLGVTALVAWYIAQPANQHILFQLGAGVWGLFAVELFLVVTISAAVRKINATVATLLFLLFAALNGVTLAALFIIYAHSVLASAFAITAGMFGAMSIYGFVTQKDLSGLGSLCFMGLVGIIIASIVNFFFMHSGPMAMVINYIGVIVFVGLTAYDTQMLKTWALATGGDAAMASRLAISGALELYLDFLNLFIMLVRILGDRK